MTIAKPTVRRRVRPLHAAGQHLRAIPRPLAWLLAVVTLFVITWALIIPIWGGPDEDVHFSYVQTLAERHELPGHGQQSVSSQQLLSARFSNTDPVVFFTYAKPEWSRPMEDQWQAAARHARRDDGGAYNAAAAYPATYYLLETIPYEIA